MEKRQGSLGALPFVVLMGRGGTCGVAGIPESKGVQAPYGARVQAAIGLAPWAA